MRGQDMTGLRPLITSQLSVITLRISNSAPSAPVVEISPNTPAAGEDDLVCVIATAAVDPDGETVTYTFAWTVDGDSYGDAQTTSYADDTVPLEDGYPDEVWTCSVIATDGDDSSTAGTDSVTLDASAQDGATPNRAGISCDQIEADWPDSYNADYWVYPDGDTTAAPVLEACIFDNQVELFAYSGAEQTWTVPSGVAYVTVKIRGANGPAIEAMYELIWEDGWRINGVATRPDAAGVI